jgi:ribosomal protein S25
VSPHGAVTEATRPLAGPTSGLAREVVAALRRLIETNAGRTMSQSALARRLNSRVRPTGAVWQRVLRRLEESGAVELMARGKQQRVRVVGWERARENEFWSRLD